MLPLIIVSSIIFGLIIILLIIEFFLYHLVFYSPKKYQLDDYHSFDNGQYLTYKETIHQMIDRLRDIPYEDAYITSFDKKKLRARVYKNSASKQVAIMFHGYRGTAYRDFSGGAYEVISMGLNVILVDERAHGKSKGHTITFGNREKKDVLSWIEYAKKTFGDDVEIILVGISMGGASVLMAAELTPDDIKIVADCPFCTPKEIINATMMKQKLPTKLLYPFVALAMLIYGRTNLNKSSAYKSVKNSNHQILIIHGDSDSIVPYQFSKRLAEENPDKIRYELFKDADHGMSYLLDKTRYQKLIKEFIEK